MKYVDIDEFIKLFEAKSITFTQFLRNAKVRIGKNQTPLKEYIARKSIPIDDIKTLFENIKNRNEYLTRFYNLSLKIPVQTHITDPPMKTNEMNNNIEIKYKNLIRNIHYKDILQNTKSGIENVPTYMDVIYDLYVNSIIDYKFLTPSALHYIKNGRIGSVFSSYYFRASIMNPYLVYSLNHRVLHGTKVFTPTLGWSSYAYGFLECPNIIEYVGTDVIPSVCKKTKELITNHPHIIKSDIYCQPSENLAKSTKFLNQYREHFDLVFFSPPYYQLELYDSPNQSTTKYKNYEDWLQKYWEETIKLCYHVLEKKGKLCYILSGYGSNNEYDLLTDMNKITKKYFKLKGQQPMHNKDVHVTKHKETAEKIMVFIKE